MSRRSIADPDVFLSELRRSRVIAILRGLDSRTAMRAVDALRSAGLSLVEITTDSPGWQDSVAQVARAGDDGRFEVGAGTVMTVRQAEEARRAGATFLVSPTLVEEVAELARQKGIAYVPGAFTPTEIHRAQAAGAACVKVFPADTLGAAYIRRLLQPLPMLRLVPTGGVSLDTAPGYLEAGAIAVAMGGGLIDADALRANDGTSTKTAAEQLLRRLGVEAEPHRRTHAQGGT